MFKYRKYLIVFLVLANQLFFYEHIYSQNFWNILVTKSWLNSVKFANNNSGWVVGNEGLVLKTTNGGEYWRYVTCLGNYTMNACYFINNYTGFLCCYNLSASGNIFKTTNSGINWVQKFSTPQFTYIHFNDITFSDSLNGWAIGEEGKIVSTTNGGNNWTSQTSSVSVDLYSICMLDADTGFIAGGYGYNRRLLKTINGGINWNVVVADSGQFMRKIFFINHSTGWILNDPHSVSKTTNGGFNWILYSHNIYGNFNSLYFIDNVTGWMVGVYGICKTTTGGVNWFPQIYSSSYDTSYFFQDVYFNNAMTGTAIGRGSRIYKTTNGGNNWYRTLNAIDGSINSVYFTSDYTGWAATSLGEIIKSTNGGVNWTSQYHSPGYSLNNVYFNNLNSGWVAGNNGNLLRTTSGGSAWNNIFCGQSQNIYAIFFINQIGWIAGAQGLIGKSVNSGLNWTILQSGVSQNLNSVFFKDANTGWVVGDAVFLFTSNSGVNWQNLDDSSFVYRTICFPTSLTGYVSAYKSYSYPPYNPPIRKILKSTNGGISWNSIYRNNGIELSSMHFFDSSSGYAVSRNGEILLTTNGGAYWFDDRVFFLFIKPYNSVFARSLQFAWAVGDSGTVASKYNGIPIGITNISKSIPWNYLLSQNYPNPFNPVTIIEYDIPQRANVILKIYDVLGREIKTLVNEFKNPGTYVVEFDGTNLSSGLYFYRLETDEFIQTKKMILIK